MNIKTIITIFFVISSVFLYQNFVLNISSSEPIGIYKIHKIRKIKKIQEIDQIQRGDVVAICLPVKYQRIGLERGYLIPGIRCAKTAPLIKTVISIPGDTVILKNNQIIVNGKSYSYRTKYFDSQGRKLAVFSRGVYKNTKKYWLIGIHDPNSWDARYWGGVDEQQILFRVSSVSSVSLVFPIFPVSFISFISFDEPRKVEDRGEEPPVAAAIIGGVKSFDEEVDA